MAFAGDDDVYSQDTEKGTQTQPVVINLTNDESQMNDTNSFFCFHCEKNHFRSDLFLWSNCNHHYSRDCALFEIRRQLYNGEMPKCVQDKSTIPTYMNNNNNNNNNSDNNEDNGNGNENEDDDDDDDDDDNSNDNEQDDDNNGNNDDKNGNNKKSDKNEKDKKGKSKSPQPAPKKFENMESQSGPCNEYLLKEEASTLLDEDTYQNYVNLFRDWRSSVFLPNTKNLLETSILNEDNSPLFVLTDENNKKQGNGKQYEMKISGMDDRNSDDYDDDDDDDDDDDNDEDDSSGYQRKNGSGKKKGGGKNGFAIVSFDDGDGDSSSSEADVAYQNANAMTFGQGMYDTQGRSINETQNEMKESQSNDYFASYDDYDEKENGMGISGISGVNLYNDKIESKKNDNYGLTSSDYANKISSLNSNSQNMGDGLGGAWGNDFGSRMRSISMGVSLHDRVDFSCMHCSKIFHNMSQFDIFEWCPRNSDNNNNNNNNNNNLNNKNNKNENDKKENSGFSSKCGHQLSKECAMNIVVTSLFSQELPRCPCKSIDGKSICNHYLMENEAIKLLGVESELFQRYANLAIEKNAMDFEDYNSMAALSSGSLTSNDDKNKNNNKNNNKNENKVDLYDDEITTDSDHDDDDNEHKSNGNSKNKGNKSPQKLRQSFTEQDSDTIAAAVVNSSPTPDNKENEK